MKSIKIISNNAIFYVKPEFIEKCPDYKKYNALELIRDTEITKFLQNFNGPALIDTKHKIENYFIDGELLKKEEWLLKIVELNKIGNVTEISVFGVKSLIMED